MSYNHTHYFSVFVPSVLLGFIAALQLTGCSDAAVGLPSDTAGAGGEFAEGGAGRGSAGGTSKAGATGKAGGTGKAGAGNEAGEASEGGEAGEAAGGTTNGQPEGGGTANGGATENGGSTAGGSDSGGSLSTGGGQGGTLGVQEAVIPATCPFHTESGLGVGASGAGGTGTGGAGGAAGTAGAAGAGTNVTLQVSPFVGTYLADAAGRTLYTYGNDLPGDCHTPPVSNCITDCVISWPIFFAGTRALPAGLDDAAFGLILRQDGVWQTTYYGWPIYYYKTDLLLGQVAGQGKSKTWHIVEKKPPGVTIMKPGTVRYLGDASGHTLYIWLLIKLVAVSDPVSSCSGDCLATFEPFHEKNFSVVTSLLQADFSTFVRPGRDTIQVAYKGMPLYRAATDLKSGDTNGTAVSGFTAALP